MTSVSVKALEPAYAQRLDEIFRRKDSLLEYNPGKCLLPDFFDEVGQKVLDAEVRRDDLWFVSFPRTGLVLLLYFGLSLKESGLVKSVADA